MADLTIRVNVETAPLGALREEFKRLKTEIADVRPNSPEFAAAAASIRSLDGRVKEVTSSMRGVTGAIKDARMEKRLFRFAVLEVMGAMQGLSDAFGGAHGTLKQLTAGMQSAVNVGLGVSFALRALGVSFTAVAGPIGIVIGLLTFLAQAAKAGGVDQEGLNTALEKTRKLQLELGEITTKQAKERVLADIEQTAAEMNRLTTENERRKRERAIPYGGLFAGPDLSVDIQNAFNKTKELREEFNVLLEKGQKDEDAHWALMVEAGKMSLRMAVILYSDGMITKEQFDMVRRAHLEKIETDLFPKLEATGKAPALPTIPGIKPVTRTTATITFEESIDHALSLTQNFQQAFRRGLDSMTGAIGQGFADAWTRAFGEAHSLLEIFAADFTRVIVELTAQAALLFVLKQVPGLGFLVPSASGGGGGGGNGGGGSIGPIASFGTSSIGRGGGGIRPTLTVVPLVSNAGLAVQVEIGDRINAKRRT